MNDADRTILDHFIGIRSKTIEMLGKVPDHLLAETAPGESEPLGWHFAHIASGPTWWMHYAMRDGGGYMSEYPDQSRAIGASLEASRDRVVSFFEADDGEPMGRVYELSPEKEPEGSNQWTGRDRVLYLTAHELHHLGRAELALWQWGVTDLPDFP